MALALAPRTVLIVTQFLRLCSIEHNRRNWLFSDSVKGAEASSIVYTIVEMAKAYNPNIYEYLKFLLEQRPNNLMTDDELAVLAPWSEILQPIKDDSPK